MSGNYAGISQWQTVRFPNLEHGFESRYPLNIDIKLKLMELIKWLETKWKI